MENSLLFANRNISNGSSNRIERRIFLKWLLIESLLIGGELSNESQMIRIITELERISNGGSSTSSVSSVSSTNSSCKTACETECQFRLETQSSLKKMDHSRIKPLVLYLSNQFNNSSKQPSILRKKGSSLRSKIILSNGYIKRSKDPV